VSTWQHVLSKLRLWELIQFERICFLDGDTVLIQNLDKVFAEDVVRATGTGKIWDATHDDEGKLPSDYSFAGIVEMNEQVSSARALVHICCDSSLTILMSSTTTHLQKLVTIGRMPTISTQASS
jgi:hypothetical protein